MIKYLFFISFFFSFSLFGEAREGWKIFEPLFEPFEEEWEQQAFEEELRKEEIPEEELQERTFLGWGKLDPYPIPMFINSIDHQERTIETSWGIDLKVVDESGSFKDSFSQWKEGDEIYFYKPIFTDWKKRDIGLKNRTSNDNLIVKIKIIQFDPEFPGTMILRKEGRTVELGDGSKWYVSWFWKNAVKKWSEGQHLVPVYNHRRMVFDQWWMMNLETGHFVKVSLEKKPEL